MKRSPLLFALSTTSPGMTPSRRRVPGREQTGAVLCCVAVASKIGESMTKKLAGLLIADVLKDFREDDLELGKTLMADKKVKGWVLKRVRVDCEIAVEEFLKGDAPDK